MSDKDYLLKVLKHYKFDELVIEQLEGHHTKEKGEVSPMIIRFICFSHLSAKMIFGEGFFKSMDDKEEKVYYWQHHLQKMVLFENPIDYLRETLKFT